MVEQDEVHGDEDGHEMMVIKLQLEKMKEKNKNQGDQDRYQIGFCFGTQNTIEGVSVFRIDSCTMKRGKSWLSGYQVPLGEVKHAYALGPSVLTINTRKCLEKC